VSLLSPEEIAQDRAMAVANMTDTVRIERVRAGRGAFNESTGQYANDNPDAARDLIYEGPCKIQIRADINSNIVEPIEVEREWGYETSTLAVPIETPAGAQGDTGKVRPDDIATMLTSQYDPALPGRVFNIHTSFHKSIATSRRFKLREPVR
jgi:hypothetical protein